MIKENDNKSVNKIHKRISKGQNYPTLNNELCVLSNWE